MAPNDVNAGDRETRIRKRAYEIWEAEGRPNGREREHWEQATGEVSKPRVQLLRQRAHGNEQRGRKGIALQE